jgi:transcriptional regulator, araC family
LLETHFSIQHQLAFYSDALSCHEKTLNQTCRQYAGLTAKQFINQRILLESKRLLAYTKASVKEIAWQLGFEEATHFGKFFKKEMPKTPLAFRKEF